MFMLTLQTEISLKIRASNKTKNVVKLNYVNVF